MKKPTTRGYYVSAILGLRRALAAGPFKTHAEALAQVEPTRLQWERWDAHAIFAAWGTARVGVRGPCDCATPCAKHVVVRDDVDGTITVEASRGSSRALRGGDSCARTRGPS